MSPFPFFPSTSGPLQHNLDSTNTSGKGHNVLKLQYPVDKNSNRQFSDKHYEEKTKRVVMKTVLVIVGEHGVVNESFPEKGTFELSSEGRVTR